MAALFKWYDRATLYVANGTFNSTTTLGSASVSVASIAFQVALLTSTYTYSASHNIYGDLTNELTTSGGYTAGGQAISGQGYAQASTLSNFTGSNVVWTASGSGIPAFRYAAIYANATLATIVKPLLAVIDNNGSDVPLTTTGNTLTVAWATNIWQMLHS